MQLFNLFIVIIECAFTHLSESLFMQLCTPAVIIIYLFVHLMHKVKRRFTYGHHTYEQATSGDDFIVTVIDNMASRPSEPDFSKLATTFTQLKLSGTWQITKRGKQK